jgi:hypothetical protein
MNLVTRKFSLLKYPEAYMYFTKGALSGIQQCLGHHLHIVMSRAETGRVRECHVTLKGADILKDMFLSFKIYLLLFSLSVGMGVKLGLLREGLQLAEGVQEYGEGKLFGQQEATADWRK